MRHIPKYPLLALVCGALCFGWSPPVSATSPCAGDEYVSLTLESVTVDGVPESDLSVYASYEVSLQSNAGYEGTLSFLAYSNSVQVHEEYSNVP